jgi:hypothetical protein
MVRLTDNQLEILSTLARPLQRWHSVEVAARRPGDSVNGGRLGRALIKP